VSDSFRNKLNMLQAIPREPTYWTAEEIKREAGFACSDKHARGMLKYFEEAIPAIPQFRNSAIPQFRGQYTYYGNSGDSILISPNSPRLPLRPSRRQRPPVKDSQIHQNKKKGDKFIYGANSRYRARVVPGRGKGNSGDSILI